MSTSAEQINQLIGGYTDLKAYYEEERDRIDAARTAALGDVSNAIRENMYFDALVDPLLPTNVSEREFATLNELLNAAPAGSMINARLAAGKTIPLANQAFVRRSSVSFSKEGVGAAPVIATQSFEFEGENRMWLIEASGDSHLYFRDVNVLLPAKANVALGWRGDQVGLVRGQHGGSGVGVGFRGCTISGSDAALAAVNPMLGGIVTAGFYQVVIDTVSAVGAAGGGVASISKNSVTLINGGQLYTSGTPAAGNILGN